MMTGYDVLVTSKEQYDAACHADVTIRRYYIDHHPAVQMTKEDAARAGEKALFIALPYMTRQEPGTPDMADLAAAADNPLFRGMLVRNLEQLAYLTETGYAGEIVLDYGVYVWNPQAFEMLNAPDAADGRITEYCVPLEEGKHQWLKTLHALKGVPAGVCVYGHTPVMISAGCVRQTYDGCSMHRGEAWREYTSLTDRTGRKLAVTCDCRYCYNVIWNAHPLSLHQALSGITEASPDVRLRLDFSTEDAADVTKVLAFFAGVMNGGQTTDPPYAQYTTGRFKKGVE